MLIQVGPFGGMLPVRDARLLPDHAAAYCKNTDLESGALIGIPEAKLVHTLVDSAATRAFRLPESYLRADYIEGSTWVEFQNPNTSFLRTPIIEDVYDRYYWCSDSQSAMYNSRARIDNGDDPYILGIPQPGILSITPSGGSGAADTRAYVCTWVSTWGEEGPASPPLTVTGKVDDTWAITLPSVASDDKNGPDRDLDNVRIYRTVVSGAGVATYYLVTEKAIGATSHNDSAADSDIIGNGEIDSLDYFAPPTDLQGFVSMPNGILAGWAGNDLYFSEPYKPHAWPPGYIQSVDYPIVGLGIIGQTLVVATSGPPATATGSHPSFMIISKLTVFEPCTARGSILSAPEGVYYSSPNGLILVNPGRAVNVTDAFISRRKWHEFTDLSALRAARYGEAYYAFGTVAQGVFQIDAFQSADDAPVPPDPDYQLVSQEDTAGAKVGVLIDPTDANVAFSLVTSSDEILDVRNDIWSSQVVLVRGGMVEIINVEEDITFGAYLWRSKEFHLSYPMNLAAARVFFEIPDNTPTLNPVENTNLVQTLQSDQYGLLRVYAGKELVYTCELRETGQDMRLPDGFKAEIWQFEIEARVRVLRVQLASSMKELRRAP